MPDPSTTDRADRRAGGGREVGTAALAGGERGASVVGEWLGDLDLVQRWMPSGLGRRDDQKPGGNSCCDESAHRP